MLFPEEHATFLKAWIVKRLENTSDADADVLADYVLALLRHDGTAEEVKALCEAEIPDFLKEDTAVFVNDVFDAIQYKSYLPGAPPAPKRRPGRPSQLGLPGGNGSAQQLQGNVTAANVGASVQSAGSGGAGFAPYGNATAPPPMNPAEPVHGQGAGQARGKKRSYNDGDVDMSNGQGSVAGDRPQKQPRRFQNGGRGGRGGFGPARGGLEQPGYMPSVAPPGAGMPSGDMNAALQAMLRLQAEMQAMGGMPQPPQMPVAPAIYGAPQGQGRQRPRKRCRDFDEKGYCPRGINCRFQHGPDAPEPAPALPAANGGDSMMMTMMKEEYDPKNATLPMPQAPIATAAAFAQMPNQFLPMTPEQHRNGADSHPRGGRGRGRGSNRGRGGARASFSADGPVLDRTKSTVVVENIPEENFTEEQVRDFFAQYGNVLDINMQPYKRLAIVKFDNWGSANAAYKSPKVIFDNRFVKVYWYKEDGSNVPTAPPGKGSNGLKNGGANGHAAGEGDTTMANGDEGATGEAAEFDAEEFARKQEEAQKAHDEKAAKKAEVEKQKAELEKKQKELFAKQAEEKQRLLAKLAAATGLKTGNSNAADANDDATPNGAATTPTPSDALRAQLALLEDEAKTLGLDPNAAEQEQPYWAARGGRGRGRGAFRGYAPRGYRGAYRGRGGATASPHAAYAQFSLDNRPRKVAVSGIDFTAADKDEALRQHLFVSKPLASPARVSKV
jgi:RNA-binding protein 26